jgi:hypothetical protein
MFKRTLLVAVSVAAAALVSACLDTSNANGSPHAVAKTPNHPPANPPAQAYAPSNAPSYATPTLPCANGGPKSVFYGVVGHIEHRGIYRMIDYQSQIDQVRALGASIYAQDVSSPASAQMVADFARQAAASCIGVLALVTPPQVQQRTNEQDAYQAGYMLGRVAGSTLKGLVTYYQVGNEYDGWSILGGGHSGEKPSDYDNDKFMKARGSILGLIKGIREANPNAKILLTSMSWLHFGFADMLFSGTQPDGTSGHPIPQWDITAWHWYSNMGSILAAGPKKINVLQRLQQSYGKPIWITEYGVRPNQSNPEQYLIGPDALQGFVAAARRYGVQNVTLYELYDDQKYGGDGNYGVIQDDGRTRKQRFDAVSNFIRSNPMP